MPNVYNGPMRQRALWTFVLVIGLAALLFAADGGHPTQSGTAPNGGNASTTLVVTPLPNANEGAPSLAALETAWQAARPLDLSLSDGRNGASPIPVELRAVYSATQLYLWLHWPAQLATPLSVDVHQQRATVTWKRASAVGGCAVVCHVSFSTGNAITDLQMMAPDIAASPFVQLVGTWSDGWWTLAYSTPLQTEVPVDIQFTDLTASYHFGLDIADGPSGGHTKGEDLNLRFESATNSKQTSTAKIASGSG